MARALIVEDEPTIALILTEVLKGEGHDVSAVSGGAAGLEWLARESPPDVVLLDLFMPRVGGRAVLEAIRSDPRLAGVPVILVTGAMPAAEDFPPEGSYQAFIGKPFNLDDVIAAVTGCLERARRQSGTGTR